ncbi:hypothetical protein [Aquimarina intermedia]|uniref:Uncharacterized protein n=1 Tax=Aquimarina intermedia TaxID=350814 RepID=A0A5S5BWJ7_9FLAO|nr:hypothetical protein [Aquimarina intermedia]TYP71561.1 hypothetical protein BD809_109143 [Aquimarina intermedia]
MNKPAIIIAIILLVGININAQELTCADFRTGTFYIPTSDEMKKYTITSNDSISKISTPRDITINKYIVIREENSQIEWIKGVDIGNPEYEILEWIDDCTYRLTYDESKGALSEEKKWINENNGIVITKSRIDGKCMFYDAIMTTNDGRKISQKGIICAE